MIGGTYIIKTATRDEVETVVDWAAAEGWNPGLHDGGRYLVADPRGFFIGYLDAEPISSLSAIRYDGEFGFIGFYIVRPEYRGLGYGLRIWNAGMRHLSGRLVGLDGVVERQDDYRKSGFAPAFRSIRYAGIGGAEMPSGAGIVHVGPRHYEAAADYARPFFPVERRRFTKAWLGQPEGVALGVVEEGGIAGYGVMRRCRRGYKIGPLFADTPELAEVLFLALKSRGEPSQPIYLDAPEGNLEAVALAERHGMTREFETARMYTGPAPDISIERTWGITSFEIG